MLVKLKLKFNSVINLIHGLDIYLGQKLWPTKNIYNVSNGKNKSNKNVLTDRLFTRNIREKPVMTKPHGKHDWAS